MRVNKCSHILLLFLGIIFLFLGCNGDNYPKILNHNNSLIVLPNAYKISYVLQKGGAIQLSYLLNENYPAESAIQNISEQLEQNKWKPLDKDYMNPGLKSHNMRKWSQFEDYSRSPARIVHQWGSDWKDDKGNIIRYAFRYTLMFPRFNGH
jgi:hypothetical protein